MVKSRGVDLVILEVNFIVDNNKRSSKM